jgi:hypothetical protein
MYHLQQKIRWTYELIVETKNRAHKNKKTEKIKKNWVAFD